MFNGLGSAGRRITQLGQICHLPALQHLRFLKTVGGIDYRQAISVF
jgi:hypothetical protein